MNLGARARELPQVVRYGLGVLAALLALSACGEQAEIGHGSAEDVSEWEAVTTAAQGQTVRWWMFGGDTAINNYVDEVVAPAAEERGVSIERVPVDDTASAVQRVIAEQRAGNTDSGSVDLIWINGENFARGKQAGLWRKSWARKLPNADLVDWDAPLINTDFGVPVEGQESPWSQAAFIYAYDRQRTQNPPRTFQQLLDYAREHPGRITYPAPPNFTGSAFVRSAVQSLGADQAFRLLEEMKPLQWRDGEVFPENEAELNDLFGNSQVDLAMSYNPNFVKSAVDKGQFPQTARPYVFETGTLQNTSYVTIPANASDQAGALVVANLLLEPRLQAIKADPDRLGIPTVLDLSRLSPQARARFEEQRKNSPYVLNEYGEFLSELGPDRVEAIEQRWQRGILQQ